MAAPRAMAPAPAPSLVQQDTLKPGGAVHMRQHRRQSSINTVSWTDQGPVEIASGRPRPLSNNLDPSDVCCLDARNGDR